MTLGTRRSLLLESLVQLAEEAKVDDQSVLWRSELSSGDGFNVSWNCRIELMRLILNQLPVDDLEVLLSSVSKSVNHAPQECIFIKQ